MRKSTQIIEYNTHNCQYLKALYDSLIQFCSSSISRSNAHADDVSLFGQYGMYTNSQTVRLTTVKKPSLKMIVIYISMRCHLLLPTVKTAAVYPRLIIPTVGNGALNGLKRL